MLLSMRKLREGILGSSRMDEFVKDVYMFNVRAAITLRHSESYVPALMHLLGEVDEKVSMKEEERREHAGYYILHLACVLKDYNEAWRVKRRLGVGDGVVSKVLLALVQNNHWGWACLRKQAGSYVGRFMDMADGRMRERTAECLSKAYFTLEKEYVEKIMGLPWQAMGESHKGAWKLDEGANKIIVRRRKAQE